MRLLDLFCGAGGCAVGYYRAGFHDITGVDINNQPRYPYNFVQADALEYLAEHGHEYDFIHASPPCQAHSDLAKLHRSKGDDYDKRHPDLVPQTRELLQSIGKPYVIENVEGAPLVNPLLLCGSMFDGLRVRRHRLFETSFFMLQPGHSCNHIRVFTHDKRKNHHGQLDENTSFVQVTGGGNCSVKNKAAAMGIDWMGGQELNQAVPPAYTQWIAEQYKGLYA